MMVSLRLSDDLYQKVKTYAKQQDTTVSQIIRRAIIWKLAEGKE